MPINVADTLPAKNILEHENVFLITKERASHQDIRPLRILILNLMPKKEETEIQLLRLLGNSPLQVDIELLQTATYTPKHTEPSHLMKFYKTFDEIKSQKFDGLIVTGAPVEHLEFEDVDYWKELTEIFEWAKTNVYSSLYICWGAQAALYYHYGIKKIKLDKKMFGIFEHKVVDVTNFLVRGFDEIYLAPHSRHTGIDEKAVRENASLKVLSYSDKAGINLICTEDIRQVFVCGHSEYDRSTLANEYFRDLEKGEPIEIPYNYFPNNDPNEKPPFIWRGHANLLFKNWLNIVYQQTPYNLNDL